MNSMELISQDVRELRELVHELHTLAVRNSAVLEQNTKDMAEHIKRTNELQKKVEDHAALLQVFKLLTKILVALVAAGGGLGTLNHFLELF